MRRMIRRVIGEIADEITECSNGRDACALYPVVHPDWVLMDMEMPEVNGIEATGLIRAMDHEARIAIVTNHDGAELREAAGAAGACAYVLKDNLLDLISLLSTIHGAEVDHEPDQSPPQGDPTALLEHVCLGG